MIDAWSRASTAGLYTLAEAPAVRARRAERNFILAKGLKNERGCVASDEWTERTCTAGYTAAYMGQELLGVQI